VAVAIVVSVIITTVTVVVPMVVPTTMAVTAGIGEGREAQCGEEGQNENETISHRFSFLQVIRE
jgi:hypothetical protein